MQLKPLGIVLVGLLISPGCVGSEKDVPCLLEAPLEEPIAGRGVANLTQEDLASFPELAKALADQDNPTVQLRECDASDRSITALKARHGIQDNAGPDMFARYEGRIHRIYVSRTVS